MSKDVDELLERMKLLRQALFDHQYIFSAQYSDLFYWIIHQLTVFEAKLEEDLKNSEPKKPRLLAWRMNDPTCTEFGYISLFEENPFAPSSDLPLWERCPWLDEPEEE